MSQTLLFAKKMQMDLAKAITTFGKLTVSFPEGTGAFIDDKLAIFEDFGTSRFPAKIEDIDLDKMENRLMPMLRELDALKQLAILSAQFANRLEILATNVEKLAHGE